MCFDVRLRQKTFLIAFFVFCSSSIGRPRHWGGGQFFKDFTLITVLLFYHDTRCSKGPPWPYIRYDPHSMAPFQALSGSKTPPDSCCSSLSTYYAAVPVGKVGTLGS